MIARRLLKAHAPVLLFACIALGGLIWFGTGSALIAAVAASAALLLNIRSALQNWCRAATYPELFKLDDARIAFPSRGLREWLHNGPIVLVPRERIRELVLSADRSRATIVFNCEGGREAAVTIHDGRPSVWDEEIRCPDLGAKAAELVRQGTPVSSLTI